MTDWVEQLPPDDRARWDAFVEHFRRDAMRKIDESAFVTSIYSDEPDVKLATELGMSLLLGKPIIILVPPGRGKVPRGLRRVADEIVYADVDTEEGREKIARAMQRIARRLA